MTTVPQSSRRKRVVVLGLGGGGFHFQMERLFSSLNGDLELVLVYVLPCLAKKIKWHSRFPVVGIYTIRPPSMYGDWELAKLVRMPVATWRAFWLLVAHKPDCVITVASALAIPFGVAARLLRIPVLYVESITRVQEAGRTGKWMRRLGLARHRYYQWREVAERESGEYAGKVIECSS